MRVGLYIGEYRPETGGGFTFQDNLIEGLASYPGNHEVVFLYWGKSRGNDERYISLNDYALPYVDLSPLSLALLKNRIDLCWFMSTNAELIHVPFVYTVWDLEHRKHPFLPEVSQTGWDWQTREDHYQKFLPRAAYVITGTPCGKQEIQNLFGIIQERVKIIPFPTPEWVFRHLDIEPDSIGMISDDPILFYPAQFWPHKNHVVLLHALRVLLNEFGLRFHLVLTGSDMGNLAYIREQTEALGLSSQVSFLGFVSHTFMACLYKQAVALVYPSLLGPDNFPPIEAFAFGCPVIVANHLDSHEQLDDAAVLVDPLDERQISQAIANVYTDATLRNRLIARGHSFAAKWVTKDYITSVYDILDEFEPYRRCWSNSLLYRHAAPGRVDDMSRHTVEDIFESFEYLSARVRQLETDKVLHAKLHANEKTLYEKDLEALQHRIAYLASMKGAIKTIVAIVAHKLHLFHFLRRCKHIIWGSATSGEICVNTEEKTAIAASQSSAEVLAIALTLDGGIDEQSLYEFMNLGEQFGNVLCIAPNAAMLQAAYVLSQSGAKVICIIAKLNMPIAPSEKLVYYQGSFNSWLSDYSHDALSDITCLMFDAKLAAIIPSALHGRVFSDTQFLVYKGGKALPPDYPQWKTPDLEIGGFLLYREVPDKNCHYGTHIVMEK